MKLRQTRAASRGEPAVPHHVGQNIETIAALFTSAEQGVGRHQLAIERVTDAVGRPATTYVLVAAVLVWIVFNAIARRMGVAPLDPPPFHWLQGVATISALLVTVAILTTQNRVARVAQHRAYLDLQVNLIAEEKIAKIIALVEELRRDLPSVMNRADPLAEAMTNAVNLGAVVQELEAIRVGGNESLQPDRETPALLEPADPNAPSDLGRQPLPRE
jgi:uncharacterized membrane protein